MPDDYKNTKEYKDFILGVEEMLKKISVARKQYDLKNFDEVKRIEIEVCTRDDEHWLERLIIRTGYDSDDPMQLALRACVQMKGETSEGIMNIKRGSLDDIEEYLRDEGNYPEIRGYLSTLRERCYDWYSEK